MGCGGREPPPPSKGMVWGLVPPPPHKKNVFLSFGSKSDAGYCCIIICSMHNTLQICYLKGCALCRRPLLVKLYYYCVFLFDRVGWFCDSDCDAPQVTQDGTLARRHPHKTPLQKKIMDRDHLFLLMTLDPRFGIPRHPLRNPRDPQDPVWGGGNPIIFVTNRAAV